MLRPRSIARLPFALLIPLLAAPAARAELVMLTTGEVVKVRSFDADEREARLELPAGGTMTLPLERIERVLVDEVEDVAPVEPEASSATMELRFADGQGIPDGAFGGLAWFAAKKHALNPALVAAVVHAESNWNPRAVSRKGACGLMQLMPATGRRFGLRRTDLFDVEKNLDAGARYLAALVERFDGNLDHVLAAYNAGEGAVDRYGGVPPYRETREYIRRIYGYLGLTSGDVTASGEAAAAPAVVSALR